MLTPVRVANLIRENADADPARVGVSTEVLCAADGLACKTIQARATAIADTVDAIYASPNLLTDGTP